MSRTDRSRRGPKHVVEQYAYVRIDQTCLRFLPRLCFISNGATLTTHYLYMMSMHSRFEEASCHVSEGWLISALIRRAE